MQRELPLVARGAFRQGVEHVNAAAEMRGGFDIGRARDRPLAGAMPVCDCLLAEAGLREVMGEQLRLRLGTVGKAGFQLRGDVRMKLLPAAAQQAGIGDIAHQRVLEQVGGLRRRAALKHKTGVGQAAEGVGQFVLAGTRSDSLCLV